MLTDIEVTKFKSTMKKKLLPWSNPYSSLILPRGELVARKEIGKNQPFTYSSNSDPNIVMSGEDRVSPLSSTQFCLLEAVKDPADRISAFENKLKWGVCLKSGSNVLIRIPHKHLEAEGVVRYSGELGDQQKGHFFGVEILVSLLAKLQLLYYAWHYTTG